jgi:hypothetical protein
MRTARDRSTMQYIHVGQTPYFFFTVFPWGVQYAVRYDTNMRECRLQTERFYLRSARCSSMPWDFSWYDPWFVLQTLTSQTDHAPIRTQYDLILWNWLYLVWEQFWGCQCDNVVMSAFLTHCITISYTRKVLPWVRKIPWTINSWLNKSHMRDFN